ncbi:MAG TPA: S41 family peptidase, partial [Verrucomicrobiales bacterium]|nr:S41 family peptidase [Verrucomicrobiales bacterium]
LRDGHARLEGCRVSFPDDSNGRPFVAPPVQLVLTKDGVAVSGVSGEAAAAGITAGALVTKIDGRPAREWLEAKVDDWLDRFCYSTRHHALYSAAKYGVGGWEGTTLQLAVKTGEGEKTIELKREGGKTAKGFSPAKQLPALKTLARHTYGKTATGNGYIHLGNTPGDLPEQLDRMLTEIGDVPGMILDMRGNSGGGCDHAAVFGRFLKKGKRWGLYESKGDHPFAGPMIVILDAGCASAGETVAGQFGEDQRACMIGDTPTAGMSSQKTRVPVPSGLFTAYFSIRSNKGRFNHGQGIEGIGVQPHEVVPWETGDLAAGIDTQIRRAEEILKNGIPKGLIDYVPPVEEAPAKEDK